MRFQTPQFIEVEDKIIGSLTIKQFVYLGGGGALCFILLRLLPLYLGIILCLPVVAFSIALAFVPVNDRPFIFTLENALRYALNKRLYIWHKVERPIEKNKNEQKTGDEPLLYVPKLADSKLKDLTWTLDIKEALNPVTKEQDKE